MHCDFCTFLKPYRLNLANILSIATWFDVTVEAQLLSNTCIVLNQMNCKAELSSDLVDKISCSNLQGTDAWLVEIFSSKCISFSTGKISW